MMMGMMDPSMMGMMGGMMDQAPQEEKDIVGINVPIEIEFVGSNSAVIQFFHRIANTPMLQELDTLRIDAQPDQQDRLRAQSVIKTMALYMDFPYTNEDIEQNILRLLNNKRDIAHREGARQLAEAEGFLEIMDDIPEYDGPEPEPIAPAGDPGMMDPAMDPMMMDPAMMGMDPELIGMN